MIFKQKLKRWAVLMLALVLVQSPVSPAFSQTPAQDITSQCKIRLPGTKKRSADALDRNYKTAWVNFAAHAVQGTIVPPKGTVEGGIYLCFGEMPDSWSLSQGETELGTGRSDGFSHVYIPFTGDQEITLTLDKGEKREMSIQELFVFSGKTPPAFVQQWQPTPQTADLLVLVAHPDDELIFMGGTLPLYAGERRKKVVVAYMTCANALRRSELLNGLWEAGVKTYPVIGRFRDKNVKTVRRNYEMWDKKKAEAFVVDLLRTYRPQVAVTHDLRGEYGHPAHIITAQTMLHAVTLAADETKFPENAKEKGTWDLPKLYIHLYAENRITMDWRQPLSAFDGRTAFDVADQAFTKNHRSQKQRWGLKDSGPYNNALFGLAHTRVGEDVLKNDFFEHITEGTQP